MRKLILAYMLFHLMRSVVAFGSEYAENLETMSADRKLHHIQTGRPKMLTVSGQEKSRPTPLVFQKQTLARIETISPMVEKTYSPIRGRGIASVVQKTKPPERIQKIETLKPQILR